MNFININKENEGFSLNYSYAMFKNVAIIIDEDTGGKTVTNAVNEIANDLHVNQIIYKDTLGNWDYWSNDTGFKSLAVDGNSVKDLKIAINSAKDKGFM